MGETIILDEILYLAMSLCSYYRTLEDTIHGFLTDFNTIRSSYSIISFSYLNFSFIFLYLLIL